MLILVFIQVKADVSKKDMEILSLQDAVQEEVAKISKLKVLISQYIQGNSAAAAGGTRQQEAEVKGSARLLASTAPATAFGADHKSSVLSSRDGMPTQTSAVQQASGSSGKTRSRAANASSASAAGTVSTASYSLAPTSSNRHNKK